ncbi:MAG: hypothetical protein QF410_14455 [Planctomycetota bacterium]|nr:hypothetical protein [Planctomycetota bacterium]
MSVTVGIDLGASLAKLAIRREDGERELRLLPSENEAELLRMVEELEPERVGLTGAGAAGLAQRLGGEPVVVNEFAAWGRGAQQLMRHQERSTHDAFLLVSVGTGTSAMLCGGGSVNRLGGTALGGGTVLGLGALLVGERDFAGLTELAQRGDRRKVDLLVGDIYRPGEIPLIGDATAAAFGKRRTREQTPAPEDLAHAIMGLVGENVALLCAALAGGAQVKRIVYGGTTLRANEPLRAILLGTTAAFGREPIHLEDGEFAGALGALALVREG